MKPTSLQDIGRTVALEWDAAMKKSEEDCRKLANQFDRELSCKTLVTSGWSDSDPMRPGDIWTADLGNGIVIGGVVPQSERRDSLPGESR